RGPGAARGLAGAWFLPTAGTSRSPGRASSRWPSPTSTSACARWACGPTCGSCSAAHLKMGHQRFDYDVLVIGAGGAGLRATIEAAGAGLSVGLVCKSLLGKAHP